MITAGLPQPQYISRLNHADAINSDIIQAIDSNFKTAVEQTKSFAQQFKSDTARQTAYKVWQFLRQHIKYKKDDGSAQLIRLPARFIADGKGDCKSYSLTAAAILANLGLPVAFRYASYSVSPIPSHVYVVTKDADGREIIVDGVWRYFDSEKRPAYKYDKVMKVYTLSGIEGTDDEINGGIGKRKRGGFFKRALNLKKKLALAPSRKSFRILVSLNLFGLAKKLKRLNDRRPGKLKSFWEKTFGGKYSELMKSVKKGYNRWAKKHKKVKMAGIGEVYEEVTMTGIGVAPAALIAVVAAAAPIVGALVKLMKKEKVTEVEPGEPTLDDTANRNANLEEQAEVSGIGKRKRKGKFARKVKKIALAKHRAAFRLAVSRNMFGLAVKLARTNKNAPKELKEKWEKLGGNYSALIKSVNAGLKRRSARGKKVSGIGEGDKQQANAIAGMIATILKALGGLIKKKGSPRPGEAPEPGESTVENIISVADDAAGRYGAPQENAEQLVDEGQAETAGDDTPKVGGFSINPKILLAAAGVGILIFANKKR